MNVDYDDLSQENDITKIIRKVKDDFGEDFTYLLKDFEMKTREEKTALVESLKNHYQLTVNGLKMIMK